MEFECWYRLAVVFERVGTDGLFPWAVLARVQQRPGAVLEQSSHKLAFFVEQPGVDTLAAEGVGTGGLFPWAVLARVRQRPGVVLESQSPELLDSECFRKPVAVAWEFAEGFAELAGAIVA
jgi:hypothetical protein